MGNKFNQFWGWVKNTSPNATAWFPKTNAKIARLRDNYLKPTAEKIDNRLGSTKTTKAFNRASNPNIDVVKNNQAKQNAIKKSLEAQKRIEHLRKAPNSPMAVAQKPVKASESKKLDTTTAKAIKPSQPSVQKQTNQAPSMKR